MSPSGADTIRVLIASDNHVGFKEEDAVRGDDSWQAFNEVMCLAKDHDVDMVLLGGDLFDVNNPSRKSMYRVVESIRSNCLGEKPCELEFLSDGTEIFGGLFNHVNYEDPNINVSIPVFSIHGNHDEPAGHEFYCALDVLQMTGLVNYFGRVKESDKVEVKPVLLRKGDTKLAIFGLSNLRDERLFRKFRDNDVKFYQPQGSSDEWFNLMVVHQNHHARTVTGYLPESFLPDFMDLVIWGHEHECLIEPRQSADGPFFVSQPGSSIATQLSPGEVGPKKVGILSITGTNFHMEPIRLKSPRPFVIRDLVLRDEPEVMNLWKKVDHREKITRYIQSVIEEMIENSKQEWIDQQEGAFNPQTDDIPWPLLRLRIDYNAEDGNKFDIENSRRITNPFNKQVANHEDIIIFHAKKKAAQQVAAIDAVPDEALESVTLDSVKVNELVNEFLAAQALKILPQNSFSDSVTQFVDRDDKHAMKLFVDESLASQMRHLLSKEEFEDTSLIEEAMDEYRQEREHIFLSTQTRTWNRARKLRPKPTGWDSDLDGHWADNAGATMLDDEDDDSMSNGATNMDNPATQTTTLNNHGSGRGESRLSAATTTARKASRAAKTAGKTSTRSKALVLSDEEDDEESDTAMRIDEDDHSKESNAFESQPLFVPEHSSSLRAKPAARGTRQSQLNFGAKETATAKSTAPPRPSRSSALKNKPIVISDDDVLEDSDDAFEDPIPIQTGRRR